MSAFGFDPEQFFRRRPGRPRVIRQPGRYRRRFIASAIVALLIVLFLLARWLLGLRGDYSFFVFTLPVIDLLIGLMWAGVIVGLLGALALAFVALAIENSPEDVPLPLSAPAGKTPRDALRVAVLHVGVLLVAIFVLATFGAHFGVYHLARSSHDTFVGLDATQRNVVRPVLGGLQVVAVVFAVITVAVL